MGGWPACRPGGSAPGLAARGTARLAMAGARPGPGLAMPGVSWPGRQGLRTGRQGLRPGRQRPAPGRQWPGAGLDCGQVGNGRGRAGPGSCDACCQRPDCRPGDRARRTKGLAGVLAAVTPSGLPEDQGPEAEGKAAARGQDSAFWRRMAPVRENGEGQGPVARVSVSIPVWPPGRHARAPTRLGFLTDADIDWPTRSTARMSSSRLECQTAAPKASRGPCHSKSIVKLAKSIMMRIKIDLSIPCFRLCM